MFRKGCSKDLIPIAEQKTEIHFIGTGDCYTTQSILRTENIRRCVNEMPTTRPTDTNTVKIFSGRVSFYLNNFDLL